MSEQEYDCHDCSDTGVLIVRDHNDSEAEVPCPECGVPIHIELARYKARADEAERLLRGLAEAEQEYRASHDTRGSGDINTGGWWDQMRKRGDKARAFLEAQP